ncbi:MAG: HNH endonuclease [Mycobacterium sp.]|nr:MULTISPECIES: HNH endonuclease signature motif containing protein [Mycobacterium]MBI2699913.1 HNH endonuclease [Mycobacterium sp.]MBX9978209.1 HNH endonuclease [Mycobacterium gordonae]MCV7008090.1 HNH endonuclease [Mycobacterium gordonae]PJE05401.1 MAG: HNH endonuclease [Mycobacterium sp.]PJE10169.1 MAG: HNH endonuclease [Mycobacterium sp.]
MGQMFEQREGLLGKTVESVGWVARVCGAARVVNQGTAAELVAIGELFAYRLARGGETEDWAIDTMKAVAGEVAAGLRISQGRAETKLRYARAMRERLPQVAAVFCAGDIDYEAFTTIVFRTDLIEDREVLAAVDARVAARVTRWPSLSRWRLSQKVDAIVARADADAVRRRKEVQADREVWIGPPLDGLAQIEGRLRSTDATALDQRLSALAATVCPNDPRSSAQRRAEALGALAAGATRLGCECGRPDCTAAGRKPSSPVVIHVIAEQATLNGHGDQPGCLLGAEDLITPELLAELALTAKQVPLIHPGYAAPEPQYTPSKALADFVRARDLTCRWPGCDVPATHCDLDHTIPYANGGPTHAGNTKCYCRTHHLMKTFWGWTEKQLADGTLILTSPAGETHVTTPGSALLFPSLCRAVGGMPAPEAQTPPADHCAERTAMMPTRRRTRGQDRAQRVAAERRANHQARTARPAAAADYFARADNRPPDPDAEPPPF